MICFHEFFPFDFFYYIFNKIFGKLLLDSQCAFHAIFMLLFSFKLSNIGSMESTINVGSQPWHGTLPSNWVPIVSRDVTRQQSDRDNGSRPPSDALLSTQSAKRRRLASKSKPEGNVEQLIADTLHSAIRVSGAQPVHAVEEVVQETSRHDAVQQSLNQDIQRNMSRRVATDPDFDAKKFPIAKKLSEK